MAQHPPERGDLVEVHWRDICEDVTADTTKATLARRISVAYFWETKDDDGMPVLVTCTTLDKDGPECQGYCIYPRAVVTEVRVIRRARKPRKAKNAPAKATSQAAG